MKTKIIIVTLTGLMILFSSCKEEWLDLNPQAQETVVGFYSDMAGAEEAVEAAYSQLCAREVFDNCYYMSFGSIASDDAEAGGSDPTDGADNEQPINRMDHNSATPYFDDFYSYSYKGINLCNVALQYLPDIIDEDPEADADILNERIAEVKFLRALYHFMLVQVYGGVPVVDHILNPDEYEQSRATVKEVFNLIEADLKAAIPDLPDIREGSDIGRASKGAAKALLVKMLIYESSYAKNYPGDYRFGDVTQRWGEALTLAEEIINSEVYELIGINEERYNCWWGPETGGYRYYFTTDGENSSESIFEIQSVNDGWGYGHTRGTAYVVYSTNRLFIDSDDASEQEAGWGFNMPTESLFNEFEAGDPRLETTIAQEGDSIYFTGTSGTTKWHLMEFRQSPTGMSGRKSEASPAEYWDVRGDAWSQGPVNLRLIRYADVVLWAAEAALESGANGKALTYINMVRKRARMSGDTGEPQDLSGTVDLDDIIHERRVELALEGHRFFDLVRWGLADDIMNGHLTVTENYNVIFITGKHEFFPLPEIEISLSNGRMVQYADW